MQQAPSPIACASFSEFKPLPGTPGLKDPKSSPDMQIVTA